MGRRRRLDNKAWNRIEREHKLWSRDFQRQCAELSCKASWIPIGILRDLFRLADLETRDSDLAATRRAITSNPRTGLSWVPPLDKENGDGQPR